jgi:hypothetical protein
VKTLRQAEEIVSFQMEAIHFEEESNPIVTCTTQSPFIEFLMRFHDGFSFFKASKDETLFEGILIKINLP